MSDQPIKRCAILGTAPTFRSTPWNDPGLEIWGLNDSHLLGFPRADRWFDLHPFGQFFYRDPAQRKVDAAEVPAGTYIRPTGHLEWMAQQSIPVYVQKSDPRVPRATVFPYSEIHAAFDPIFPSGKIECSSTPQWMLMLALLEGYQEIHIYGIHLATEWEYQKQRELFAFLMGVAAGRGVKVVIPKGSPLLKTTHEYAFAPDPATPITALKRQSLKLERQRDGLTKELAIVPWYRGGKAGLKARLMWLDAQIADIHAQVGQLSLAQRLIQ
jgi:hypothetical protein